MICADSKETEPDRGERRRMQILGAATECFRRRGFHNASMAEISKAAGMSVGHIYHYFENKERIINAIVTRGMEELIADVEKLRDSEDVFAALVDSADKGLEKQTEQPAAALKLEVLAEATHNPLVLDALREADARVRASLKETLSSGCPGLGQCGQLLDGKVSMIGVIFDGLAIRAIIEPGFDKDAILHALRLAISGVLYGGQQDADHG